MKPFPFPATPSATSGLFERLALRSRQWSLAQQLLFSLVLTVLVLTVVAGTWISDVEKRQHHTMHEESLQSRLNLLKASSLDALVSQDVPILMSIVEETGRKDPQILALDILDRTGETIAQWKNPVYASAATTREMETQVILRGEDFGLVRVTWDLAPHLAEVRAHTRWLVFILALVLLTLTTCLVLLTGLLVVRPIRIIHQSLQREVAPTLSMGYAASELQLLSKGVAFLLQLKHEIKRSEQRYRGLFDNTSAGCIVLSGAGDEFRIEDINESFRLLPVLALGDRPVTSLREVLEEPAAAALYAALRDIAANRGHSHIEELALSRDGHDYWLDCHIFAIDSGELVLMIRDVTDRKISRDLRRAKEAAEQANELKSAFLASMSHEIRTPLNGVLSMVELMRGTRLSNKQRHWVEAIRGSGHHLLSTINDILDFSRIEAGRLLLEDIRFSLGEVIGNLFNATSQRAFEKGLELVLHQELGLPDQLLGDPFRIQQVLINLVGNAIKFTESGEVEITLNKQEIPGNRILLYVAVRDTGVGIAPELVERVFLPFEQGLVNRFQFSQGTGLGLAISKRLVDAMGGDIGVESRLGEGSVFHFEVPLGLAEAPRPQSWLAPDIWRRCPALVWVRHGAVRESVIRSLNAFGFVTHIVSSADEAVERASGAGEEERCCLVVLDDSLIGQEGAALQAELKTRGGVSRLFVLYVVNMFNRDKGELDNIDALPDTAYVMKPVHASVLYNVLQKLFGFSDGSQTVASKLEDLSWERLIERMGAQERLSGARILLVEDNLVNQEVAVEALAMAGIEVLLAANGEEAVDLVRAGNHFDGVLMDLQMPVMDGFKATQIIRQQHSMEALPIIAMTAGVLFKDRQRSLEVGMNDHVGKPVNLQNLMETLMKWVKPAYPRPLKSVRARAEGVSPLERALAVDGEVDWGRAELPGIMIYKGLNRLGGDRKLYFKLLKSFGKAHDNTEAEMLAALSGKDFQTLRLLAHTLKGVATTLGAELLHVSAATTEIAAVEGRFDAVRVEIEPLIVHLNQVLGSIKTLLKSARAAERDEPAEAAAETGVPPPDSAGLYAEIAGLLERSDTRLQEVCATNRAAIRTWFAGDGVFDSFMEGIELYRFEEARETFLGAAVYKASASSASSNSDSAAE